MFVGEIYPQSRCEIFGLSLNTVMLTCWFSCCCRGSWGPSSWIDICVWLEKSGPWSTCYVSWALGALGRTKYNTGVSLGPRWWGSPQGGGWHGPKYSQSKWEQVTWRRLSPLLFRLRYTWGRATLALTNIKETKNARQRDKEWDEDILRKETK